MTRIRSIRPNDRAEDFLTRALAFLAPNRAARRVAGQIALDRIRKIRADARRASGKFGYEAAKPSRLYGLTGLVDGRSIDGQNQSAIARLRSLARHVEQNFDLGEAVLHEIVSNVVGRGIRSFPMVKNREGQALADVNDRLSRLWIEWGRRPEVTRSLSWNETQRLLVRTWARDGEVFQQLLSGAVRGLRHSTAVGHSIELLEPDLIPYTLNDAKNRIRQGVEKNAWGEATFYHVLLEDPRETFSIDLAGTAATLPSDMTTKRVAASRMLHLKAANRIRQTRGISIFATVFLRLEDLKDFEESERIAARLGAAIALAINRADGAGQTGTSESELRELEVAPGFIVDGLGAGESVTSFKTERPNNDLPAYRKSQLQAIAGGTGTRYSGISRDFSGTYSSQRQELVEGTRAYEMLRDTVVDGVIRPNYRRFVDMVMFQGLIADVAESRLIDLRSIYDATHVGPGAAYIDVQKEATADEKAVQAGFKSRSQVVLERTGRNPAEVREEIAAETEADKAVGLAFSTSPKQPGADQTGDQSDDEPPDQTDADTTEESVNGSPPRKANGHFQEGKTT